MFLGGHKINVGKQSVVCLLVQGSVLCILIVEVITVPTIGCVSGRLPVLDIFLFGAQVKSCCFSHVLTIVIKYMMLVSSVYTARFSAEELVLTAVCTTLSTSNQ